MLEPFTEPPIRSVADYGWPPAPKKGVQEATTAIANRILKRTKRAYPHGLDKHRRKTSA